MIRVLKDALRDPRRGLRGKTEMSILKTGKTTNGKLRTGGKRMNMEYEQVKKRVDEEDKALKRIVIETGIGMLTALLITIFLLRV